MLPTAFLLSPLLFVIFITATPVEVRTPGVTLPIAKRIRDNASGGAVNLIYHDRARFAAFKERGAAIQSGNPDVQGGSIDVTNLAVSYIASIGVGEPATTFNLIVDTGSSNTWVGASTPYKPTSTSTDTGATVSGSYGSGNFSGEEWLDTVSLSSNLVVEQQSIGVANSSYGFDLFDGVLGIGPAILTLGSLTNSPWMEIPTVSDNLYNQNVISTEVVSVFFEPPSSFNVTNGELFFGGVDPSKYTGDISYIPITSTFPASLYWGIDQSVTYGDEILLSETAGVVDTGTTLVLLASDAYDKYRNLTGATEDATLQGWLTLTASQYSNLQNLNFIIGSETYTLIPNAQIWPRALNTYIGGDSSAIYSIVGSTGTTYGQGLDFFNGQAFLERFYSVFDTTNQQVGFATTKFTNAIVN